jgi:ElaB/YqjD/DUF883 family membrane-anchored ribosome-binding protein
MTHPTPSSSETDIPKQAEDAWDNAKADITDGICDGEAFMRANPLWTVLGALAVGVALGLLVSHRDKPTPRQRYIDEPLEELQSLARTLSERAARKAGRGSDAAVSALESILKRIKNNLKF